MEQKTLSIVARAKAEGENELKRMAAFIKGVDEMPGNPVILMSEYLAQREKELS